MNRQRVIAVLIAMTVFGADAADSDGNFAIKGAGVQTCKKFVEAWDKGNTDLRLYAGWIAGYVTALNQHNEKTYDAVPWQTTETLLGMTWSVCGQLAPDTHFLHAFDRMLSKLRSTRLGEKSDLVGVRRGERTIVVYHAVLDAAKARLTSLGHDAGPIGADFDQIASNAFRSFQEAHGLEPSGLPDQKTLFALFLGQPK